VVLVPDARKALKVARVAVRGNNAQQVAARYLEDPAAGPLAEFDGPQGDQAGGLGRYVVGLDIEVTAGRVVYCLDRGD
jgi:hypothetical protein